MLIASDNINTCQKSKQHMTITNEFANYTNIKLCKVIQYHKNKFMPIDNTALALEGDLLITKQKVLSFHAMLSLI